MTRRYDRRSFFRTGGAAAALGLSGSLLEACSNPSQPAAGGPTTTTLGPSGATDHKAPRRGGSLAIGTWSEVNSLSPPTGHWDATGYLYGNALFDSLVQVGADGRPHPYLARSFSANPDNTVWTFELRSGVTFHNGEACDAAAVANSLNASRSGLVTAETLRPVEKIEAVGATTVRVTLDGPWPAFPSYLAGQIGYICAPAMLASPDQGATRPIGTGPFSFESWVPDSHLEVKANRGYWQHGFPYLDAITFKPVPDNSARADALLSGSINLMHCQAPRSIRPFFGNSRYQVITGDLPPRAEPDVDFVMLNLEAAPLDDRELRRALAMSIDTSALRASYGDGLTTAVEGPFVPGELWYEKTGYPSYDPAEAKRLVAEYAKRTGTAPAVKLTTITGPDYAEVAQIIQQGWQAAGVQTTVGQVDFTTFVTDSVLGTFQACTYELFGATDPDQNYIWWSTDTVARVGEVSLNMARNSDKRIQRALVKGRRSTDLASRAEAYKDVSRYLAEDLPYLWLGRTYWAAVCQSDVVGVTGQSLPGGARSIGFNGGSFLLHQLAFTG